MEGIMGFVVIFIGIVIMVSIGTVILGSVSFDCTSLSGYNSGTPASSTGWAKACLDTQAQGESAYALLIVVIVIVAAAIILRAVGLFG